MPRFANLFSYRSRYSYFLFNILIRLFLHKNSWTNYVFRAWHFTCVWEYPWQKQKQLRLCFLRLIIIIRNIKDHQGFGAGPCFTGTNELKDVKPSYLTDAWTINILNLIPLVKCEESTGLLQSVNPAACIWKWEDDPAALGVILLTDLSCCLFSCSARKAVSRVFFYSLSVISSSLLLEMGFDKKVGFFWPQLLIKETKKIPK